MNETRRARLDQLTRRWRSRHDAARPAERPPADEEREERARISFPFREMTPAEYAERHGAAMTGFTYDDYSYTDPELDTWLVELGSVLRAGRTGG